MHTKQIEYRGGIVTFVLPDHWVEEYDPAGGATFYEDRPDSGTLRLRVQSFSSDGNVDATHMAASAFPDGEQVRDDGSMVRRRIGHATENGEELTIVTWDVAVPVPPHQLRIASFSHTILRGQEEDPAIAAELQMVDAAVRAARFSQQQGVTGA